jgi:hypothetical protein
MTAGTDARVTSGQRSEIVRFTAMVRSGLSKYTQSIEYETKYIMSCLQIQKGSVLTRKPHCEIVSRGRARWQAVERTVISMYTIEPIKTHLVGPVYHTTPYSDFQLGIFQQRSTKIEICII